MISAVGSLVTGGITASATRSDLPGALQSVLLIVLLVATCVWIGGWFSLIMIARTATATLQAHDRVAFFRHYGRRYGTFSTIALIVALACGLVLLLGLPWTALSTWIVIVSAVLAFALVAGVVQARRLTRERQRLVASSGDEALAARIRRGARRAIVLRSSLGVISVAILVMAVIRMS